MKTLAIDIGGTGLKCMVLDPEGTPITERTRVLTPQPATPTAVLDALEGMFGSHGAFDRISCGFPGVVVDGVTMNAPNLDPSWAGQRLGAELQRRSGVPARVANDADVQGYGVVEGHGVELVLTLGTGMGSALFLDGTLVPNLELGHHPFRKDRTYEDDLGKEALLRLGKKRWNRRLEFAIAVTRRVFNWRVLHLGGGHAKKVRLLLPDDVRIAENRAGLLGGIRLWDA